MESELIECHVARVAARGVGVGRQSVDHRAVREARFELLRHRAFKKARFGGAGDDAAGLDVRLDFLHQQARLPFAFGKENPGCLAPEALKHGAERGGERKPDLPRLDDDLERRAVPEPALLVGQELERGLEPDALLD